MENVEPLSVQLLKVLIDPLRPHVGGEGSTLKFVEGNVTLTTPLAGMSV